MKKAIISLSGGLDSTCLLMYLLSNDYEVKAYSFDYGQKHKIELKKVKKNIKFLQRKGMPVTHQIINLKDVFSDSASTLHQGGAAIPHGHYADENMKSTVVENRNIIFSAIIYGKALSWANKTQDDVVITQGLHNGDHCFTRDTKILTAEGLKTVDELKIGDKVYSFNKETLKTEIDECIDIIKKGTNNIIYNIQTTSGKIRLTSEHKVYVVEYGDMTNSGFEKKISHKLVKDLKVGDIMITPNKLPDNIHSDDIKDELIDIKPIVEDILNTNNIYKDYSIIDEDNILYILTKNGKKLTGYNRYMNAKSLLNIIAWYITEGWSSNEFMKRTASSRFLSSFSQSFYKNFENTEKIHEDLNNLNIPISVSKKIIKETNIISEITYQFNSIISVLMRSCGSNSNEKCIPNWIMKFLKEHPEYISEFVNTMVEGDGHYDKVSGLNNYTSKSFELIQNISELIRKLDMYIKITYKDDIYVITFGSKNRKIGLVRFGDAAMTKVTNIEIENKLEDVFDISIKNNHNFFAGDLGNVLISNSIYPDCRPESQEMARELYKISNWGSERVDFIAPFINIDKSEVLKEGLDAMKKLEFSKSDIKKVLRNTHTCYDPDEKGRSCGKCGSCTERLEAFESACMKDPIPYQE